VRNRGLVTDTLNEITRKHPSAWWIGKLDAAKVGCGPINMLDEVFSHPQVEARGMLIEMDHPATPGRPARLIASPLRLSASPVSYRRPPPMLGEHTGEVLGEYLGIGKSELAALKERGVV
jgi:crotonobetainyl-CoA:carnitine CoA-transferase CaiB-like acyl-CoA transferase